MDYIIINKDQREKIKQITSNNFEMEWSDPKLIDILLGSLSRLENYNCGETVRAKVNKLEKIYSSYSIFTTNKISYVSNLIIGPTLSKTLFISGLGSGIRWIIDKLIPEF